VKLRTRFFVLCILATACSGTPPTIVVRGATLIDGTGAPPVENSVLVAEGGRVQCTGAAGSCTVPEGADEVDGAGFWIIPGLIDTRIRLRYGDRAVESDHDQRLGFLLGVTTTRAVGAGQEAEANRHSAIGTEDPWLPVPRLIVSEPDPERGFSGLTNPSGIEARVEPLVSGAGHVDGGGPGAAELRRHLIWARAAPDTLGQIAASIARRGMWIEPLLAVEQRYARPYGIPIGLHRLFELPLVSKALEDEPVPEMSEEMRATMGEALHRMGDFLLAFHDAGGILATGSDQVIAPGLAIHAEVSALVEAGLSNAAALAAATRDAARVIGVQDSLGTLEAGKIADFVVLEGDPLADVANLQLIARVAKGGVLYDPSSLLDNLAKDLRNRTTPSWKRLLAGFATMLIVAILTLWGILRQRAGMRRR